VGAVRKSYRPCDLAPPVRNEALLVPPAGFEPATRRFSDGTTGRVRLRANNALTITDTSEQRRSGSVALARSG